MLRFVGNIYIFKAAAYLPSVAIVTTNVPHSQQFATANVALGGQACQYLFTKKT